MIMIYVNLISLVMKAISHIQKDTEREVSAKLDEVEVDSVEEKAV